MDCVKEAGNYHFRENGMRKVEGYLHKKYYQEIKLLHDLINYSTKNIKEMFL